MSSPTLLCLNTGSASLKFALFPLDSCHGPLLPEALLRGEIDNHDGQATLRWTDAQGQRHQAASAQPRGDIQAEVDALLDTLIKPAGFGTIAAVAHRIVHGGTRFTRAHRITPEVRGALDALRSLAPLHQGPGLAGVDAATARLPEVPQIACFDTAFHATQSDLSRRYAIARPWHDKGFKRYGFHGLSYDALTHKLPPLLGERARGAVVVAHLGGGSSLCGLRQLRSVATTMGFTALDGVMMSTRSGAIDPGLVLHWITEEHLDARQVTDMLYHDSGLKGVSGISGDLRTLEASTDPRAEEAIALFAASVVHHIGALAADIGGLDALVFTGGIGTHSARVRQEVCNALAWLGLRLDPLANAAGQPCITHGDSPVPAYALPTDEEGVMALQAVALLD
ncbi:acetate/propionate family kinase [Thiomonas bhubaneswarensis]|uniref:Acetate kinase n=1 Tax=Thiomonas bhubaneswarensis TaxID=339866 RepID=A0A0K6I0E6_9BURK|nr:acetate/propionate family kinase [Thiomonas bhubaneswarensis]CUA96566.1 acetate kinase [Thiomonas bhubaneswarensis]